MICMDDIATLTPAEIDTFLAANWTAQNKAERTIAFYTTPDRSGRLPGHNPEASAAEARAELDELSRAAEPYEARFAAERWNRYFIVQNNNGHVHRDMTCSTCFPTTQYGWLPELSDCDEAAMVAEYGELACTVCFPDAPAAKGYNDGTSALARYSAAEKAEKARIKAEKDAAKAAKAITSPDGSPLRTAGKWGNLVKTEVTARRELTTALENTVVLGYPDRDGDYAATIARMAEALEAKTGQPAAEIVAEYTAKVLKKNGRR